jgi:hypothetical protein
MQWGEAGDTNAIVRLLQASMLRNTRNEILPATVFPVIEMRKGRANHAFRAIDASCAAAFSLNKLTQ